MRRLRRGVSRAEGALPTVSHDSSGEGGAVSSADETFSVGCMNEPIRRKGSLESAGGSADAVIAA